MTIKGAISTEGMPIKIIPYSPEMLTTECGKRAFQDILLHRIQTHYDSYEYMKSHQAFSALIAEIEDKAPELRKVIGEIDNMVVSKETECFDAGYKAGMADLMTSLTFNHLQIINTQLVDFEAIDRQREAKNV